MTKQSWLNLVRVISALAAIFAMGYQLYDMIENRPEAPVSNFFSFFTIQSNIFAAVILLVSVQRDRQGRSSPTFDLLRGAATVYMTTTGVVYGVLLSGYQEELQTTTNWVDTVVHKIMPLVMIADWLIAPPRSRIVFPRAFKWLIYPMLYLVYSLIRGPIVDWYPYPFLDPDEAGGYLGVALYSVGIAVGIGLFSWIIAALSKRQPDPSFAPS